MLVQPSTRRAYTMDEYENAGAIVQEDLSPASLVMAVKQVRLAIQFENYMKAYSNYSYSYDYSSFGFS